MQQTSQTQETLRPRNVAPSEWRAMSPKERASAAMHVRTEEWDFRGSLSDMKPTGIPPEDLAIVARVMLALAPGEMERLVTIGRQAANET